MDLPGLSSRPGVGVQSVALQRYGSSVSPVDSSCPTFFLVASFGRCKFRLCPVSVGLILQATIGGSASAFGVVQLADRVFRFSVSNKLVGFHIVKLKSFQSSCFKVFFHLWSNGGPRWELEFTDYCKEEASSWSEIRRNSSAHKQQYPSAASKSFVSQRSFVEAVKLGHLTGANAIPMRVSAFDRLKFPENLRQFEVAHQHRVHSVHAKSLPRFSQAGNDRVKH